METNVVSGVMVVVMLLCSVIESRDSNSFDATFSRRETTDNTEATYNIMIYNNNHLPPPRYEMLGDILYRPMDSPRHQQYSGFERGNTIAQFDGQSGDFNQDPNDVVDNVHQPIINNNRYSIDSNFMSNGESGSDIRKPARMLYELLKNYGSFSESDFGTVYNNWFGH